MPVSQKPYWEWYNSPELPNPDEYILWASNGATNLQDAVFPYINVTIATTWLVMFLLVIFSFFVTRNLTPETKMSRWQNLLEVIVSGINKQIEEVSQQKPERYLSFIGTLFIFIAVSNLLFIFPGYIPPTSSLSTTTAFALMVFIAVPVYGLMSSGVKRYLKGYFEPTPIMLPFNIIGELSSTLALAVRLYGNVMSGTVIGGILISLVPFFIPIVMQLLGLLTGIIQAYIFAILAMVYIASGTQPSKKKEEVAQKEDVALATKTN